MGLPHPAVGQNLLGPEEALRHLAVLALGRHHQHDPVALCAARAMAPSSSDGFVVRVGVEDHERAGRRSGDARAPAPGTCRRGRRRPAPLSSVAVPPYPRTSGSASQLRAFRPKAGTTSRANRRTTGPDGSRAGGRARGRSPAASGTAIEASSTGPSTRAATPTACRWSGRGASRPRVVIDDDRLRPLPRPSSPPATNAACSRWSRSTTSPIRRGSARSSGSTALARAVRRVGDDGGRAAGDCAATGSRSTRSTSLPVRRASWACSRRAGCCTPASRPRH